MLNITAVKTEINGGPGSHQGLAPFQIILAGSCGCNFPENCQTLRGTGTTKPDIKLEFLSQLPVFSFVGKNPLFILSNFLQSWWGEPRSGCEALG